jgi:restriction system protein
MRIIPWADHRAKVDGAEFERLVAELLREAGRDLPDFRLEKQELIRAHDGQYRIDVALSFTQLGVHFLVLVECKDHARPIEREDVQVLADKTRAAGAHKAILFSTNGFQRGAIDYARIHGIALIRLVEGALTYETRALSQRGVPPIPPPWANIPPFVAQHVYSLDNGNIQVSVLEPHRVEALAHFLSSSTRRENA